MFVDYLVPSSPTFIDTGLTIVQRLQIVCVFNVLVTVYVQQVVKRAPVGVLRFVAALPALAGFLAAPLVFHWEKEILLRTALLFTSGWLGTFKIVALCINRGPVAQPLTFLQAMALLHMPIFPAKVQKPGSAAKALLKQGRLHDMAGGPLKLLGQAIAKTVLLGLVVFVLVGSNVPLPVLHYIYALGLVGFLGLLMDAPATIATSFIGVKIIPTFDQPWLSSSLGDFWGRRWNITTSSVLRTLVYDPVVEGRLIKSEDGSAPNTPRASDSGSSQSFQQAAGSKQANGHHHAGSAPNSPGGGSHRRIPQWKRALGVFATFFVSGIAHELILSQCVHTAPGAPRPHLYKWLTYFTVQSPMLLTEAFVRKWWRKRGLRDLNVWVARLLTTVVLIGVADSLFFAPVDRDSDLADRVVHAVQDSFIAAAQMAANALGLHDVLRDVGIAAGKAAGAGADVMSSLGMQAVIDSTKEL